MKLLKILLVIVFTFNCASAQDVDLTFGEPLKIPLKVKLRYDLVYGNGGLTIANLDKKDKLFTFFNIRPDLSLADTSMKILSELPKKYEPEFFVGNGAKRYWLYSSWDKSKGITSLWAQPVDIPVSQLSQLSKTILTSNININYIHGENGATGNTFIHKSLGNYFREGYMVSEKFRLNQSLDSSKFSIRYLLDPIPKALWDSTNTEKYCMIVYDNTFNVLWSRIFEMQCPTIDEWLVEFNSKSKCLRVVENTLLTNNGEIAMLTKKLDNIKKDPTDGSALYDYNYQMLIFSDSDPKPRVINIDSEGKYLLNGLLYEGKKGQIFLIGYYGETKTAGADGIYVYRIDEILSGNIGAHQFSKFPSIIGNSKSGDLIKDLEITDIISDENGGFYVLGEVQTNLFINAKHPYTLYTYNDIYVCRIDNSGKILWMNAVTKRQKGKSIPGSLSYNYIIKDDNLYLFYVDNVKNLDLSSGKEPNYYEDGLAGELMATKLNTEGEVLYRKALFYLAEDVDFQIKKFIRSGNKLIYTSYSRETNYRPVVLTVK